MSSPSTPRRSILSLERLEGRITPIIGQYPAGVAEAFTAATVINPGDFGGRYDAVGYFLYPVDGQAKDEIGSGSLFRTAVGRGYGHHLLTAAHVVAYDDYQNTFHFKVRTGATAADWQTIPYPVQKGADFRRKHPDHVSGVGEAEFKHKHVSQYDLSVVPLVDPVQPDPSRLLVAPFGAKAYGLPERSEDLPLGQAVELVGHGKTGHGAVGATVGATGTRRVGVNRVDMNGRAYRPEWDNPLSLAIDFDNGDRANDLLGLAFGVFGNGIPDPADPGRRSIDAMIYSGDSGGPWLLNDRIVGVSTHVTDTVKLADGTPFNAADYNPGGNGSWGELGVGVNVAALASFVHDQVGTGAYDLVLDMKYQPAGVDGFADTYTIVAERVGGDLVLRVEDAHQTVLNGEYYRAPVANINSLTIRGHEDDSETLRIVGDLGFGLELGQGVYFDGREGGKDAVEYDFRTLAGDSDGNQFTLGPPEQQQAGWQSRLTWAQMGAGGLVPKPTVHAKNVEAYTLATGSKADIVRVDAVPPGSEVVVAAGAGVDKVTVGSDKTGLAGINGTVRVSGGDDYGELTIDDAHSPQGSQLTLGYDDSTGELNAMQLSRGGGQPSVHTRAFHKVTIQASGYGDTVRIDDTSTPTHADGGIIVHGNAGSDTVYVGSDKHGLDGIGTLVRVTGGGGTDNLVIEDRKGTTTTAYRVLTNRVEADTRFIYNDDTLLRTVRGRRGAAGSPVSNSFRLLGNPAGAEAGLTVEGGPGADRVLVDGDVAGLTANAGAADGPTQPVDEFEVLSGHANDPALTGFEWATLSGGTLTLNGINALSVQDYEQSGGVLAGTATVLASKYLIWTGGEMRGAGRTVAGPDARLDIDGDGLTLVGRTLVNEGFGVWVSAVGEGTGGTGTVESRRYLYPGGYQTGGVAVTAGRYTEGGTLVFDLGGGGGGSDLVVAGEVTLLPAATLYLDPVGVAPGMSYVLISNTGTAAVSGRFAGLPEGGVLTVGGRRHGISYAGGDGNDVVLTAPPPLPDPGDSDLPVVPPYGPPDIPPGQVYFTRTFLVGGLADPDPLQYTVELVSAPTTGSLEVETVDGYTSYYHVISNAEYPGFTGDTATYRYVRGDEHSQTATISLYRPTGP